MKIAAQHKKWVSVFIALLSIIVLTFTYKCGIEKVCKSSLLEKVVRSGAVITLPQGKLSVEIADTPSARMQGLSGRTGLDEGEGMLFVFDQPGRYGFWMKDMTFPIDIVWISQDGYVVHMEKNVSPDTYFKQDPPQTFVNTPNALYVLELGAGEAEKHGLYLGTKVKITQ